MMYNPFSTYAFNEKQAALTSPVLAILLATVVTAVVQSASAIAGMVIMLAQNGLLDIRLGICFIFGANIGT